MAQSNLPKNIFSFSIRYINNSLPTGQNLVRWNLSPMSDCRNCLQRETLLHVVAGCKSYLDRFTWRYDSVLNFLAKTLLYNTLPTRKNLVKWGTAPTSECSYCLEQESLLHVVAGCKSYLNEGRFTWRHDSVLNFIASIIKSVKACNIYADLPGFISPSVITGDKLRPDLVLTLTTKCIYILELTIGFESNLLTNTKRKRQKYEELINEQQNNYEKVKFVNMSLSSLGVFSQSSIGFTDMLKDLNVDEQCRKYYVKKVIDMCIRSSYYIFCKRNKECDNPQLMPY